MSRNGIVFIIGKENGIVTLETRLTSPQKFHIKLPYECLRTSTPTSVSTINKIVFPLTHKHKLEQDCFQLPTFQ